MQQGLEDLTFGPQKVYIHDGCCPRNTFPDKQALPESVCLKIWPPKEVLAVPRWFWPGMLQIRTTVTCQHT